jgi:hypothetical protein
VVRRLGFVAIVVIATIVGPSFVAQADSEACSVSAGVRDFGSVIVGTPGDDVIDCSGSPRGRTFLGEAGDDRLVGSDSAFDVFDPGPGVDRVDGGTGPADIVYFTFAPAPVVAATDGAKQDGYGNDESGLYAGIESLWGSRFGDQLIGDAGPNALHGSDGDDFLLGWGGRDLVDGGSGTDTASFAGARRGVEVDLGAGTATGQGRDRFISIETIRGSGHDDLLTGSAGADTILGGPGTDLIRGLAGDDVLEGGGSADTVIGGAGADTIDGGLGFDGCLEGVGTGTSSGCEAEAYGQVAGLALFPPTRSPIGIGFHESLFPTALAARPSGPLVANGSSAHFAPPEPTDGSPYVVMASRGRGTLATTAADVVVPSQSTVYAPVNGEVVLVRTYLLYCETTDWQIIIRPDGGPDLLLMVLHIVDVRVRAGDRVIAQVTPMATSWGNDALTAQENVYFPDQYPHVHVEVERAGEAPIPGCSLS